MFLRRRELHVLNKWARRGKAVRQAAGASRNQISGIDSSARRCFPPPWSVEEQDACFVGSVKKRTVADHRLSIRAVRDGEETLLFWDNRPPVGPT